MSPGLGFLYNAVLPPLFCANAARGYGLRSDALRSHHEINVQDRGRIEILLPSIIHILMNLVANASEAIEQEGTVIMREGGCVL